MLTINVYSKDVATKDGRKFKAYYTKMMLDGQEHWVTLKFKRDVTLPSTFPTKLECDVEQVSAPAHYIIKEENGKKVYPTVWIRGYQKATPILVVKKDKPTPVFVTMNGQEPVSNEELETEETEIECDF